MKKHTKFNILHFALAASVSLLLVLAAPAGADFFTQVGGSTQGQCPGSQIFCGALNYCTDTQTCNTAMGIPAGPSIPITFPVSCPTGQFQCASLNNQCSTFADCDVADQAKFGPPPTTTQTTKTTPTTNQNKNTDNPFNISTFGDKDINIPKLPSSVNLTNTKTFNTLITKITKTKSNEEAMGKILSITQALSDICDSSNLKCAGRDKLSTLIEEAAFDGLGSKNMKGIKKAFEKFAKAFSKELRKKP